MKRLFGQKKAEEPKPTLDDANSRLNNRGDAIDAKCSKIDEELVKLKSLIQNTRGAAQQRYKQRAMQLLQQKRMYQGQRDTVYQQQMNIDQLQFTSEMMKDTHIQVSALKDASKDLKKQFKNFRIEDVENMQDELRDLYEETQEIQEVMGRAYDLPEEVDEDEMMAELDGLAFDMEKEKDASYLDEALSAPPTRLPPMSAPTTGEPAVAETTDPMSLEAQLGL
jgi:charged multivesicular body protein 5